MKHPYCVGLTGGIGAGKTTVSDCFAALGVPVIDTDVIARALVAPGTPGLAALLDYWGTDALGTRQGGLNRGALRARIAADPSAREAVNRLLHPRIRAEVDNQLARVTAPYTLVVVPLLFESKTAYDFLDRVCVVDCPEAVQVARVAARDQVSTAAAEAMLAIQASRANRLSIADDVVSNISDRAALTAIVQRLHADYLVRAAG